MSDVNEKTRPETIEPKEPKLTFTQEYAVVYPRCETAYMIPASGWERIKRDVKRIVPAKNWFVIGGSICAGVFVSAVFCIIGLAASTNPPVWAKYTAWSASIVSLVLCVSLFYLESQQRGDLRQSTSDVIADMEKLEQTSNTSETDEATPSTR
jgi:hypothetical protein